MRPGSSRKQSEATSGAGRRLSRAWLLLCLSPSLLSLPDPALAAGDASLQDGRITYQDSATRKAALQAIAKAAGVRLSFDAPMSQAERGWSIVDVPVARAFRLVLGSCNWAGLEDARLGQLRAVLVFDGCEDGAAPSTPLQLAQLRADEPPSPQQVSAAASLGIDGQEEMLGLRSADRAERLRAVAALSMQRSIESRRLLAQLAMGDADSEVRINALEALAHFGSDAFARGIIGNARGDADPRVAQSARRLYQAP